MKDISGQRFGKWLILWPIGKDKHRNMRWVCQCDCGKVTSEML